MKKFSIEFHSQQIWVEAGEDYRLSYPDGKWVVLNKHPDDTKTIPVSNANVSYSTAFVWSIKDQSQDPDWLNKEQLQVIGELITRREHEMENV